jgi:hypothetical protein
VVLDGDLHCLSEPRGKRTPALDRGEGIRSDGPVLKRTREYVGRRYGILNGKIDPHPADRRHRVSCIPNAEQTGTPPLPQAIHFHG